MAAKAKSNRSAKRDAGIDRKTPPKRSENRELSAVESVALHAAYLELHDLDGVTAEDVHPAVRHLARQFGADPKQAHQLAFHENWEAERRARDARRWQADAARGAASEDEFVKLWTGDDGFYSHLCHNAEGTRLAAAMARETWRRVMAPALYWEALQEERAAREAYDALPVDRRAA